MVEALVPLWGDSDRLYAKRLAALPPLLVEALESHCHLVLEAERRRKLTDGEQRHDPAVGGAW